MSTTAREIAYRLDPVLWAREVLGVKPRRWQEKYLRAPRGQMIACLTTRQGGKSTVAAWGMAHSALFLPKSLSVIASPTQPQSGEVLRKFHEAVIKAGAEFKVDSTYKIELANGSRVLALPGDADSIRGLTVNAWIVVDEAARVAPEMMAALHPMRIQCPDARFVMLSTPSTRTDPFWQVWSSDDPAWMRIKATVDVEPDIIDPKALAAEQRRLSEDDFKREYLGIPAGGRASPFTFDLYDRATRSPVRRNAWDFLRPAVIAHDVGRSIDRSTAVVGGVSPFLPEQICLKEFEELQQGLFGQARANELAAVDRRYDQRTLVIADVSNDTSYLEPLVERFGSRLIGLHITRHGDGMTPQPRLTNRGAVAVYPVGRTVLLDMLHTAFRDDRIRILAGPAALRAYEQLMGLEVELRESGRIYECPSGHHDDLAISMAMLVWALQHPHFEYWTRVLEPRKVIKRQSYGWGAFV